ncbi:AAA-domain-containing protein [Plenodomus tracheiphilus IPT5]|uniref:AAA-domain-containing protein n=1 Tax=Plenodomus tracheiphilus IPT5 TaxID=1408161 RepID=A0A6A7BH36_9PLEO|nr:AAA-domain-containing protein [Plenodomus tracheiphilus IPT5]
MTKGSPTSARQNGVLHVEVKLAKQDHGGPKAVQLKEEVEKYLRRRHTEIQVGTVTTDSSLSPVIKQVEITGHSKSMQFPDEDFHLLAANEMDIVVYSLFSEKDLSLQDWDLENYDDAAASHFTITPLPHEAFDRLWPSLVFEEPVGEIMLRALVRSIREQHVPTQSLVANCKNTVLFHGPPGSGKTSLAQAVAQRLSIRLSELYPRTELLEVASDALLSKFFGESSKAVGKLFKKIVEMAVTDRSRFLVVLFDEVESIAGCREQALKSSEVADAHRAAVQMLRGLDAVRKCANVVFICTTNFIGNIDSAFLDRIFLREYISVPAVNSILDILRGELNDLLRSGRMVFSRMVYDDAADHTTVENTPMARGSSSPRQNQTNPSAGSPQKSSYIPDAVWAATHWAGYTHTVTSRLYVMAQQAKGLSGRRLRDLVEQARLKYTVDTPCDLRELLDALDRVIGQETSGAQPPWEGPPNGPNFDVQEGLVEPDLEDIAALLARIDGNQAISTVPE